MSTMDGPGRPRGRSRAPRSMLPVVLLGLSASRAVEASGVAMDICSTSSWVAIVRVEQELGPQLHGRWHYDENADHLWVDRWVTSSFEVAVERTVVGRRYSRLRVERCCGGEVLDSGEVVADRYDLPLFATGKRFLVMGWTERAQGADSVRIGRGRAFEIPLDATLPPDGVLHGAWTAVCDANPWGWPPRGVRFWQPAVGYDSPLLYAYPEPNPAAEMPSGVAVDAETPVLDAEIGVGLAVPPSIEVVAEQYGVRLVRGNHPCWVCGRDSGCWERCAGSAAELQDSMGPGLW